YMHNRSKAANHENNDFRQSSSRWHTIVHLNSKKRMDQSNRMILAPIRSIITSQPQDIWMKRSNSFFISHKKLVYMRIPSSSSWEIIMELVQIITGRWPSI